MNYRPICIQSSLPKLFEKIVLSKINPLLNKFITVHQHGFHKSRSTVTNLLLYETHISRALSMNKQVDSIYTDFSKAFDKVSHKLLVNKLSHFGFAGSFLSWLNTYLSDRTLMVRANCATSHSINVTSGVPQGSHLGPILFNIFINDIPLIFHDVEILMFADDLKLFKVINNIYDCITIQNNLDILSDWCIKNRLHLNVDKCLIMIFYRIKNPLLYSYSLSNSNLCSVAEISDLGITFDTKLSFSRHVSNITGKALKMLGFILRVASDFKNTSTIRILYTSLVRSCLEYGSTIWNPCYKVHIASLERVQHKFLRYVNFRLGIPLDSLNYDFLLNNQNLLKLSERRIITDLIFLFKIVNGMLDCPDILSLVNFNVPVRMTRQCVLYYCSNIRTVAMQNSTLNRLHSMGNKYAFLADVFDNSLSSYRLILIKHFSNHGSGS